jgi:hypothetical protein
MFRSPLRAFASPMAVQMRRTTCVGLISHDTLARATPAAHRGGRDLNRRLTKSFRTCWPSRFVFCTGRCRTAFRPKTHHRRSCSRGGHLDKRREASCASFPLRRQLKPFQRESDRVGACLDSVNRSIQFWRDQFRSGVRLRHSSKEVILSWCPPVAAGFDHVALHFPFTFSPSAVVPA